MHTVLSIIYTVYIFCLVVSKDSVYKLDQHVAKNVARCRRTDCSGRCLFSSIQANLFSQLKGIEYPLRIPITGRLFQRLRIVIKLHTIAFR